MCRIQNQLYVYRMKRPNVQFFDIFEKYVKGKSFLVKFQIFPLFLHFKEFSDRITDQPLSVTPN